MDKFHTSLIKFQNILSEYSFYNFFLHFNFMMTQFVNKKYNVFTLAHQNDE